MILEIIVIVCLIVGIIGVIVFYHRRSKSLELVISKRFSDQRNKELLETSEQRQDELIESARKIQDMETTIDILSGIKSSLELKLDQTRFESKQELEKFLIQTKQQIEEIELKAHQANKKSLTLGQNIIKGELVQILASFSLLT